MDSEKAEAEKSPTSRFPGLKPAATPESDWLTLNQAILVMVVTTIVFAIWFLIDDLLHFLSIQGLFFYFLVYGLPIGVLFSALVSRFIGQPIRLGRLGYAYFLFSTVGTVIYFSTFSLAVRNPHSSYWADYWDIFSFGLQIGFGCWVLTNLIAIAKAKSIASGVFRLFMACHAGFFLYPSVGLVVFIFALLCVTIWPMRKGRRKPDVRQA